MRGFDTIIVGAGSAGCVLAGRLSEDAARRVLLLEAGPDHRDDDLPDFLRLLSKPVAWPYDWSNQVESAGRQLHYGRGRGTGGSSATNGGVALRPEPEDVDAWGERWRWDDLLPSLNAIERDVEFGDRPWHGAAGPVPITRWAERDWNELQAGFVAGCVATGFTRCVDHNEPGTTGVGAIPMNRVGRTRVSAAMAYLEPARGRPNLTVEGEHHVQRVVLDGRRVTGVVLDDGQVVHADDVILAAGVIQDPLLLRRSGVDNPHIGRHLTDHFVMTLAAEVRPDCIPDDAPSLQTILRLTAPGSDRRHDLQITPWVRRHGDGRRELGMSISLQLPDGEGEVEGIDEPVIRWPFTGLPSNVSRLREGWRIAAGIAQASGLMLRPSDMDAEVARSDADLDRHITESHTAFYHGVGTCRLGDVVDPECRVLGVDGLRIVDASIIPTVPRSNTNLAVMAIAERFARLELGRRGHVAAVDREIGAADPR